ncbi:MAG: PAS domain S-box protein [Candidatus Hydrogenedentes bacterium]|nr:PAS domain S-box protein [Candidatus Hydrogenedentota bacterium]
MGKANDFPESRFDARRLRRIALVPLGWVVFLSLIPDFLLRVSKHSIPWISATSWGIGIILICGFAGYLITRVRRDRRISFLVFTGISLLVVSESFRIAQSVGVFENPAIHDWVNELRAADNLLNGLGLVLIALAFFHTIVAMLASRQQLLAEHARLSAEIARREQVENSLRGREALLNGISASAFDAIIVMDNAGLVSYWNPSAERILGYRSEEIIGKSVHELLAPASQQQEFTRGASDWQHTGQGPVVGRIMALKAVAKNGSEIDVELSVSSVEISGQWHAVGILRDVTQRKQAEEELRTILKTAMDGFWIVDREGRILDVNNTYCHVIGYSREELLNMRIQDVEAAETYEEVIEHIRVLHEKGADRFETHQRRKDGTIIDVEVSVNGTLRNGDRLYVFIRDITEQKRTEELLKESEERYRTLFDQAVDGIMIMPFDGKGLMVNEAFAKMHGYGSPQEMGHLRLPDLDTPETAELAPERLRRLMDGEAMTFEVVHYRKDGSRFPLDVSCNVIDSGGKQYLLGFHHDITERKHAEALLEEHRVKMIESARLSSLGTMAGGVAHEINNPLAVIAGCAEQLENLVMNADTAPATTKKLAGMMRRNASRIQRIVQGLRELSRDGSGDPFVPTPVVNIIADVLELCQERFRVHGIRIEDVRPDDSLLIECVSRRLPSHRVPPLADLSSHP